MQKVIRGKSRGLIFDFDGTLANSLEPILRIINEQSSELGYRSISSEDRERFRDLGARQILAELGIPLVRLPFLMKRIRAELNRQIASVEPIRGIPSALKSLKAAGVPLGILTSNSGQNVRAFLERHRIDFFDYIYSGTSLFGKSIVLRRLLKERGLCASEVFYVGDEMRDIDAARQTSIPMISVGWGFNTPEALRRKNPDHLCLEPRELARLFASPPVSRN